jgi:raffinose/stachyose/melibiose transport system substrate-binding protein
MVLCDGVISEEDAMINAHQIKGGNKMKQKVSIIFTGLLIVLMLFVVGCAKEEASNEGATNESVAGGENTTNEKSELSGTLTFAIWDNNLNTFIEENDMVGKFQKHYPDVDIEVEKMKDDSEYWNAMKMRASANQLPDIMFNKPFTLSRFQDFLLDIGDTQAAQNNLLAEGYAVDGKILGVPLTSGYEYVYYWKDLFEEANVEVPTTWEEFEQVSLTLQEYYGKDNQDFMALAIGLKDEWPNYPFMEFMPALESGNGENWNRMASQDRPFEKGQDVYEAYHKIYNFFNSGVLGRDPLGIGNDQATSIFATKGAAMIALGDWGLQNIAAGAQDISELGTFYLPARNSVDEPYNVIVQGDSFMGVTTHSTIPEAAIAFVEWFYSDEWYPDYINYVSSDSSMKNFPKEKNSVLAQADQTVSEIQWVMYNGGNDAFSSIQNETTFDYKKLGAEMRIDGFDFETVFEDLNQRWTEAREKLNID